MAYLSAKVICRPDSAHDISKIADRILRASGAVGALPTPIDNLIQTAKVEDKTDVGNILERFFATLDEKSGQLFRSGLQKLRGIADIRERAIYVPQDTVPRLLFVKAHELGHQVIPWQQVHTTRGDSLYYDTDITLSPEAQEMFDIEANFFASEVIFQGRRFTTLARDYKPSFDAVFVLADLHGASKQATLRRYIEEQDEIVAAVSYLPSLYEADNNGATVLRSPWLFASPKFHQKYGDVQLPTKIKSAHPWAVARDCGEICDGEIELTCGNGPVRFQWQAWWNSYALLVLLRRKPLLSLSRFLVKAK